MSKFNEANKKSSILLYEQIKMDIKQMIESEMIKQDEKLPNEMELCKHYNTSRITIRRAINELVQEGYVEKVHGKGTFVIGYKKPIHILDLKGFSEGLSMGEVPVSKKIISIDTLIADKKLMRIFKRDKPFKYIKLVRVISDEHEVLSVDHAYLPLDIYPDILKHLKDDISTFKIINECYDITFAKTKKKIEVQIPPESISKYFSSPLSAMRIEKTITDIENRIVHYSEYYLAGNRVSLIIESEN